MADGNYDETNRGVFFKPHPEQQMIGQGKLNIEGNDHRIVVVKEKMSRDGDPVRNVYMRVGVLFDNDKQGNDKAPDMTGPLDQPANWRLAGWIGQTQNGTSYCSLSAQEKQQKQQDQGTPAGNTQQDQQSGDPFGGSIDDEIPFAPEWRI